MTPIHESRRLIVKIGSSLLVEDASGTVRDDWLSALAADVADLHRAGRQVVIVSSGSIAVGRGLLNLGQDRVRRPLRLEEKQAAAAAGQIRLARAYQEALGHHGITVAQVLLTPDDTENRRRHLNARATIEQLLHLGAIPVINENDTVATSEIRFGDNDRLAARVAQMISADSLVLLSDIDGLYTADPAVDANAERIDRVEAITPAIEAMAGEPRPGYSSGGMVTKLAAARICLAAGCRMAIAKGNEPHALAALAGGQAPATWFWPRMTPVTARKRWILASLAVDGRLHLDAGAVRALRAGKSLLPAGVKAVTGRFQRGDCVMILGPDGRPVGRGLSAYSADDAARIAGAQSAEIVTILGFRGRTAIIHRDDLVMENNGLVAGTDAQSVAPTA